MQEYIHMYIYCIYVCFKTLASSLICACTYVQCVLCVCAYHRNMILGFVCVGVSCFLTSKVVWRNVRRSIAGLSRGPFPHKESLGGSSHSGLERNKRSYLSTHTYIHTYRCTHTYIHTYTLMNLIDGLAVSMNLSVY